MHHCTPYDESEISIALIRETEAGTNKNDVHTVYLIRKSFLSGSKYLTSPRMTMIGYCSAMSSLGGES